MARVGVAHQEVAVVKPQCDDLVDQREQQRAVGAGTYAHPFVGDRRIAGAYRVDRDEAAAPALEFRDRDLHRIGVMVLGRAYHHEQLGAFQVRPAEFPERTADRVDHAGGHVHRTEAAVRGIIGRAELAREQAGQRLHLVAPREQRELLRVGGAQLAQPFGEDVESLFPADLLVFSGTAFRAGLAAQRLGQPRRGILLHDAGTALGADHAVVERMIRVAVYVAYLAVAQMDAYPASACAHIAGSVAHLVLCIRCRGSQRVVQRGDCAPGVAKVMVIHRRPVIDLMSLWRI